MLMINAICFIVNAFATDLTILLMGFVLILFNSFLIVFVDCQFEILLFGFASIVGFFVSISATLNAFGINKVLLLAISEKKEKKEIDKINEKLKLIDLIRDSMFLFGSIVFFIYLVFLAIT